MADEDENPGARPLIYRASFSIFYICRGLGINEWKLMNTQTEHEVHGGMCFCKFSQSLGRLKLILIGSEKCFIVINSRVSSAKSVDNEAFCGLALRIEGGVLLIDLLGKWLTPRPSMRDRGSTWWTPANQDSAGGKNSAWTRKALRSGNFSHWKRHQMVSII